MSLLRHFYIKEGYGLILCLLGVMAHFWLGKRFRVPKPLNYAVTAILFFTYLSLVENFCPPYRRVFPPSWRAWIGPLIVVYFVSLSPVALLVWLRSLVPAFQPERRTFLSQASAVLCTAPFAGVGFGILTREEFERREVDLKIPGLPKDLCNLRMLQLSDIHLGAFLSTRVLERIIDASNELRADIVFVTGDLITYEWDPLDTALAQIRRLRSPAGLWGCLGNHEMYAEVEDYTAEKAAAFGMRFLRQESARLTFGASAINLSGVDYQRFHRPYLVGAEKLVAMGDLNLLLSHNPDVFPVAVGQGFDLVLAGHTHGGQVNVEILSKNANVAMAFTPYTKGLYTQAMSTIYVNSGIGTIGLPLRLGAPPEITILRLCEA